MADDDAPEGVDNLEEYLRGILSEGEDTPPARAPDAPFLPATSPLSENIDDRRTTLNDDPSQEGRHVSSRVGKTTPSGWDTLNNVWRFADGGSVPEEGPDEGWAPVDQPTSQNAPPGDGWAPVDKPVAQDDGWAPVDQLPAPESAAMTVGRKVVHEALPFAASLPAMGAGAELGAMAGAPLAPFSFGLSVPIGAAIGAGAAGFGANWLASAAEDKIESLLGIDDSAQRQSNAEAHSTADMVGDIIPMAAGFKVGQLAGSLVSRGINAAGMGGVSAAQQLATTGKVDPTEMAEQAALGAIFNEPRSGTAKLMGAGSRLVPGRPDLQGDQSAKADVQVPPPPAGQPGVASEPVRPTRREVGDETGSANEYPKENAKPEGNDPTVTQGDIDPATQAALDSMAKPRPDQKPLTTPSDTGLAAAAPRPPAAQAAIEGRPPTPEPSASEATPAPGEVPPSAEQSTDVQHPILPNVQVERAELPPGYIARSDNAGTKVYLAPGVPETLDVNGHQVPVADAMKVHEVFERRGIAMLQKAIADGKHPAMSDDKIYAVAHEKVGTAAERAYLEEHVGTPEKPFTEADFALYQKKMEDLARAQKGGEPPTDLYRFMDAHEQALHLHTPEDVTGSILHEPVTATVKEAPAADAPIMARAPEPAGLKPLLKMIAEHPTMDAKAKSELSAKFKTATPEVIAKAYEGLRPRSRASITRPDGTTVQARDAGDLAVKQRSIDATHKAMEAHPPPDALVPVSTPGRLALQERAKNIVDTAKRLNGGESPVATYNPTKNPPAGHQLFKAAVKFLKGNLSPNSVQTFLKEEALARSHKAEAKLLNPDAVDAGIGKSRRSGEAAIDSGVAHRIEPFAEQDTMAERIDEGRTHNGRRVLFDTPHEEGEQGRTAEPIASREDLERVAQGKETEKPFDIKDLSPAELAQLAEHMAKSEGDRVARMRAEAGETVKAEDVTAAKTAALRALRLAKNGARPLMPEVEKRARFAWSELNPINHARGARPISRTALDIAGPKGRSFMGATKVYKSGARKGELLSKPGEHVAPGGASAKILDHLDKAYPDAGAFNTHAKPTPKDEYFASIHDGLHKLAQQDTAHTTVVRQWIKSLPKELSENPARMERIFRARERGALDGLDQQSRELYNKYLQPAFDKSNGFAAEIRSIAPEKIGDYVENHVQRIRHGATPELDMLSGISGDPIEGIQGISTARHGAMNDRVFSVLERKSDNRRFVVSADPDGKGYTKWQGGIGTHVDFPGFEHKAGSDLTNAGIDYKMRDAYTDEIEKNAKFEDGKPAKYYHNPILSAAMSMKQLSQQLRHIKFLARTVADPRFQENTTTNSKLAEEKGYVTTLMPQFKGVYMDKNLARIFDQYAKPGFDMPQWAHTASQAVTKMLFFLPVAHIANVGTHWFVGRGWDWITPQGYRRLAITVPQAIRSVMSQDAMQLDLYRRGMSGRLGAVLSKDTVGTFGRLAGEVISRDPEFPKIAKVLGVGAEQLTKAIYDGSMRVMWAANDVFLTQQILENQMKGMTKEMAIAHAERHIPNYRIPASLISNGEFGRQFAKFMEDPVPSSFGRYHVGVFNSYATMVHDMLDKSSTGKQRLDAVGNLMALGLLAYMVKPALDKMVQVVTGNPDAETHSRGPLAVPASMARALRGQDDIMNTARNMASTPPLVSTVLEALHNKDFAGRQIVQPGDVEMGAKGSIKHAGKAVVQEVGHAVRGLVAPYNVASNAWAKGQSLPQSARDQLLDINEKSQKALKYDRTQPAKAERTAVSAKPSGPMEALYDKMFGRGR